MNAFRSIPTATSLANACNLRDQYRYNAANTRGLAYYIVMGEITEDDRETYFIATAREVRKLKEAGFEVLE